MATVVDTSIMGKPILKNRLKLMGMPAWKIAMAQKRGRRLCQWATRSARKRQKKSRRGSKKLCKAHKLLIETNLLRHAGAHHVGRGTNQRAVAPEAGAKGERPHQGTQRHIDVRVGRHLRDDGRHGGGKAERKRGAVSGGRSWRGDRGSYPCAQLTGCCQ